MRKSKPFTQRVVRRLTPRTVLVQKFPCGCVRPYNQRRKLCWHQVQWLRRVTERVRNAITQKEAAELMGVGQGCVSDIVNYKARVEA